MWRNTTGLLFLVSTFYVMWADWKPKDKQTEPTDRGSLQPASQFDDLRTDLTSSLPALAHPDAYREHVQDILSNLCKDLFKTLQTKLDAACIEFHLSPCSHGPPATDPGYLREAAGILQHILNQSGYPRATVRLGQKGLICNTGITASKGHQPFR